MTGPSAPPRTAFTEEKAEAEAEAEAELQFDKSRLTDCGDHTESPAPSLNNSSVLL